MNCIVNSLNVNEVVKKMVVDHEDDAIAFFKDVNRLDIVMSINELAHGLKQEQTIKMIAYFDRKERFLPFSFPIGDYMISGFLSEDSDTKYQIFTKIKLHDKMKDILATFIEDLNELNVKQGFFITDSGLHIRVINFNN